MGRVPVPRAACAAVAAASDARGDDQGDHNNRDSDGPVLRTALGLHKENMVGAFAIRKTRVAAQFIAELSAFSLVCRSIKDTRNFSTNSRVCTCRMADSVGRKTVQVLRSTDRAGKESLSASWMYTYWNRVDMDKNSANVRKVRPKKKATI